METLEHCKSFNNRIYFLKLIRIHDDERSQLDLVLKVCGHYFGSSKVQNEVGTLLLLNQYCSSVPTPKVFAWSTDGKTVERLHDSNVEEVLPTSKELRGLSHGWVLMSRLPGRIIQPTDLEGQHHPKLLQQLAQHVFTWRTALPEVKHIGNIRFESQSSHPLPINVQNKGFTIGGLILTHKYSPAAYSCWSDYYEYTIRDKYEHLLSAPELKSLAKRIAEPVSSFLPLITRLPFLAQDKIEFTHMDLSPRNVLISEDPLQDDAPPVITGIIDWEFAAFLPSPMEWLQGLINQCDDWPEIRYKEFLTYLSELEQETEKEAPIDLPMLNPPELECVKADRCLCGYHVFKHLSLLEKLIENVAPWWVTPTAYLDREAELEEVCHTAEKIVFDCIEKLTLAL